MAKDVSERHASMMELASALTEYLRNTPTASIPGSPVAPLSRPIESDSIPTGADTLVSQLLKPEVDGAASPNPGVSPARPQVERAPGPPGVPTVTPASAVSATPEKLKGRKPPWPVLVASVILGLFFLAWIIYRPKADSPRAADSRKQYGRVSLFNGKDLEGWKNARPDVGDWKVVEGGFLEGRGSGTRGGMAALITERLDFKNYRLQMKYRYSAGAGGAVFMRHSGSQTPARGYWVTDRGGVMKMDRYTLGYAFRGAPLVQNNVPAPTDTWNTLEILAMDNKITTFLNGTKVTEYEDTGNWFPSGGIELVCSRNLTIQIERITIEEIMVQDEKAPG
jgi:hypothetical protein